MRKILFIVLVLLQANRLFAQRDPKNEILVFFKEGIAQKDTVVTGAKLIRFSLDKTSLRLSLKQIGLTETMLEIANPRFAKGDTLKTLSDGTKLKQMDMTKLVRIKVPKGVSKDTLIKKLKTIPEVLYAEANSMPHLMLTPNDSDYPQQWGLHNTFYPGDDIHAEAAWDIFTGDPNGIIAIIDGGVDVNQPDIANKIVFADNGTNNDIEHGTATAGIAAAQTNNSQGVAGVDWQAKILSKNPIGGNKDDVDAYNAIVDAVNYSPNVRVLNNSWGSLQYSTTVAAAFAYVYKADRVAVAAMSNDQMTNPNDTPYPAALSNVIAVGATGITDQVTGFSDHGNFISVVAPGQDIVAPKAGTTGDFSYTGCSFAAPFVTGVASLLKGYNNSLANDDIKNIIELSADKIPAYMNGQNFTPAYGYGRLNAASALGLLQAPNSVNHFSITGGTDYSTTGYYTATLYSFPYVADGAYIIKRHEVRAQVNFPYPFCITGVWGRGVGSTGVSPASPNYGEGFADVVPGTITSTGATVRTYVYELYSINGQYLGYYPTTPANVTMAYTVLGIANQEVINGAANVCSPETYTVSNVPTGPVTYNWTVSGGLVIVGSNTNPTVTVDKGYAGHGVITLVINGCSSAPIVKYVWSGAVPPTLYDARVVGSQRVRMSVNPADDSPLYYNYYLDGQLVASTPNLTITTSQSYPCGDHVASVTAVYSGCGETATDDDNSIDFNMECADGGDGTDARAGAYPNPVNNNFTVTTKGNKVKSATAQSSASSVNTETTQNSSAPFSYLLYDRRGKIWRRGESTSGDDVGVNVADIPSDTYFLHIKMGKHLIVKQIIVSH